MGWDEETYLNLVVGGGGRGRDGLAYGIGHLRFLLYSCRQAANVPPLVVPAASNFCQHERLYSSWLAPLADCSCGGRAAGDVHREKRHDRFQYRCFLDYWGGGGGE